MRIIIDMQGSQTESRFRGIGRYALALVQAIVRNAGEHDVWLVLNCCMPETIPVIRKAFESVLPKDRICVFDVPRSNGSSAWMSHAGEMIREAFIASLEPDIVLLTSLFENSRENAVTSVGAIETPYINAVILYDLIPLLYKEQYLVDANVREHYEKKIKWLKKADLLLSISEATRQESIKNIGSSPQSIVNISGAVDKQFRLQHLDREQKEELYARLCITRKVILYVPGGFDPRKNFPRLIEAISILDDSLRKDYQLVISGKISPGQEALFNEFSKRFGLDEDDIVRPGYLEEQDLISLYSVAELFVFPSTHEGFGLPILEAMACGAPVIGSNSSSIPEVIGLKDALFDPHSTQSIAKKITEVLTNEEFYRGLIEHGLKQVQKFSWDTSAKKALKVFEKKFGERLNTERLPTDNSALITALSNIQTPDPPSDGDIVEVAVCIDNNNNTAMRYKRGFGALKWRIEGPFDSSYSLSLLNRETAIALDGLGCDISLHSTEGPGDFDPDTTFLNKNHLIKKLHAKSFRKMGAPVDITSRNLYPPRVSDMQGSLHFLHHYAWEETGFPEEWGKDFNEHLDGMTCLSRHVKKIMIDNGVCVPMWVSGCGVDHWERIEASKRYVIDAKSFKFLHVSSCFPRKGADLLLQTYGDRFTSSDDVSLIIKTFPNPHNEIHKWLKEAQRDNPDFPDVVIIEDDLPDAELKALYEACDVLVSPSRAEGFGLPMAEAMLSGLPVITTRWSGQLDFCNDDNSWLVDFEFEKAQTHFGLFSSVWAKPDVDSLSIAMEDAFNSSADQRKSKARAGKKLLLKNFKWSDVVKRYVDSVVYVLENRQTVLPRIAWLSTWKSKCGIAMYSNHLINQMENEVFVFADRDESLEQGDGRSWARRWVKGKDVNGLARLLSEIEEKSLNTVVIQFNYGFYNHKELSDFIRVNIEHGRVVVLVLHSTVDPENSIPPENFQLCHMKPALEMCDRIMVHSVPDLNRLKQIGLVDNVALFPHGILDFEEKRTTGISSELPVVASFGFCLPNKGLEELVEAAALLKQRGTPVLLRLANAEYPVPESAAQVDRIKQRIEELGLQDFVNFNHEFLDEDESLKKISAADLAVFPYQQTGESSSAAVRYGLASKRPVAVTPLAIFDDVSDVTFRFSGTDPKALATGIQSILENLATNSEEAMEIEKKADRWRDEFAYSTVARRLFGICSALLLDKKNNST